MPNLEINPLKTTSIRIDPAHNLELHADLANKTAEVVNLVTGEQYAGGGGGDSDFSTAEVTITNTSETLTNMYIPNANELSGTPFEPACIPNIAIPSGQTVVISAVLYKGRLMIPASPDITPSGDAEISNGMIIISGDCTLTLS